MDQSVISVKKKEYLPSIRNSQKHHSTPPHMHALTWMHAADPEVMHLHRVVDIR